MKFILFSLSLLIGFTAISQETGFDRYLMVTVDQLNMREEPNNTSKIMGIVSKNMLVKVLDSGETDPKTEVINGMKGDWIRVEHNNKTAYMFDGYLEGNIKITNDLWAGDYLLLKEGYFEGLRFSPELNWYGIYSRENGEYLEEVSVNIEYKINRDVVAGNDLFISTNKAYKSTILIGTKHKLKPGLVGLPIGKFSGAKIRDNQILPCPVMNDSTINNEYYLRASNKGKTRGNCQLKQYALHIYRQEIDKQADYIQQLEGITDDMNCYFPQLFWYGDINRDGVPDYIFLNARTTSTTYKLYLSERKDENTRIEKVAIFIPFYIPC